MKGGSNIKTILKFIGTGIEDNYQACVNIYDNNNLLYERRTYNGKVIIDLRENKLYKMVATSINEIINTSIYVTKNNCKYIFKYNRSILQNYYSSDLRTITFLLTDANYNNLPIEKGELFLWQKQ